MKYKYSNCYKKNLIYINKDFYIKMSYKLKKDLNIDIPVNIVTMKNHENF